MNLLISLWRGLFSPGVCMIGTANSSSIDGFKFAELLDWSSMASPMELMIVFLIIKLLFRFGYWLDRVGQLCCGTPAQHTVELWLHLVVEHAIHWSIHHILGQAINLFTLMEVCVMTNNWVLIWVLCLWWHQSMLKSLKRPKWPIQPKKRLHFTMFSHLWEQTQINITKLWVLKNLDI